MTKYSTYTDEQLAHLLKNSDEAAFKEIYDRYWKRLYALGFSRLRDHNLVEEIVHDVFLDIWTRRKTLVITSGINAYLAVAMKYRVINILVRNKNKLIVALDHDNVPDPSGPDYLEFEELRERLARYVAGLPERCRLVYQLSREEGLSQKEIAKVMNISEKAVEHQITRALRVLRSGIRQFLSVFL